MVARTVTELGGVDILVNAAAQPGGAGTPRGQAALPAVGTILDEAPAGARVLLVAEVADEAEQLVFDTAAELTTVWCHRSEQHDGFGMLASQAVRDLALPHGRGAAWSGSRCTPGATGSWASPITRTTTPARTDLCRRASTSGRSAKEKTIIIPNGPEYYDLSHLSALGQPLPQGARRRPWPSARRDPIDKALTAPGASVYFSIRGKGFEA